MYYYRWQEVKSPYVVKHENNSRILLHVLTVTENGCRFVWSSSNPLYYFSVESNVVKLSIGSKIYTLDPGDLVRLSLEHRKFIG